MSNTKNTQESQSAHNSQDSQSSQNSRKPTDKAADDRPSPMEVLRQARGQLAELTGMTAESVSSFEQTEQGWALEVEVLELERVPDTMSLMASYQVELDAQGQLTGYRRVRRYERGRSDPRRTGGH
ncbi:gas vesicle protein [Streptomyces sp. NPDC006235]